MKSELGYPRSLLTPKTALPCPSKNQQGPALGHPEVYRVSLDLPRPAPTPKTSGSRLGVPGAGPRVWF